MWGQRFKFWRMGYRLEPKLLNDPIRVAERTAKFDVVAPLGRITHAGGTSVYPTAPLEIYAKLTAVSSGAYSWTQRIPAASGGWTDGPLSGTPSANPAYNTITGVVLSLPLDAVLMRPTTANDFRFSIGSC